MAGSRNKVVLNQVVYWKIVYKKADEMKQGKETLSSWLLDQGRVNLV